MKITELLWLAIDLFLYIYCLIVFYQIVTFILVFVYQFTYLSCWTLKGLRTQIRLSLVASSVKSTVPLARHTRHFFLYHHRMTRLILQLDHGLTSQFIFTLSICGSFFVVYGFSTAILRANSIPMLEMLLLLYFFIFYIIGSVVIIYPVLATNRQIQYTAHLHSIQLASGQVSVRNKIRFQTQYEQLHNRRRLGFTFGPIGTFSSNLIMEVADDLFFSRSF